MTKDDDNNAEPEKENPPATTYNTELILTTDTSIQQVYYEDSDGNFKAEFMLDPSLRKWSKKLNFEIGDTIKFGGSVVSINNKAETEIIYTGEGSLDTIFHSSSSQSSSFEATIIP